MAQRPKKFSSKAEEPKSSYTFTDEATKNKIKRHLCDIKDVITEEDIANVKIPGCEDETPSPPVDENIQKDNTTS